MIPNLKTILLTFPEVGGNYRELRPGEPILIGDIFQREPGAAVKAHGGGPSKMVFERIASVTQIEGQPAVGAVYRPTLPVVFRKVA